jgi:hypothetical protein
VNAQPYYGFVDMQGNPLENFYEVGYTPDIEEYLAWLEAGVKASNEAIK